MAASAVVVVLMMTGAWVLWSRDGSERSIVDDSGGSEPRETRQGDRDQPELVIVGDSVTFLSIDAIVNHLGDDHDLDIRAYPGQGSSDLAIVVLQEVLEREGSGDGP